MQVVDFGTGPDPDSEDARRGHRLRCTYGLAAVKAEHKRKMEYFTRRSQELMAEHRKKMADLGFG